jgi:pSer/pThr/pTyr-binding forkhead associated (FHA) protein
VSRIHAELRLAKDGVFVVDLDSANGTLLNGRRLPPQTPESVRHGDIIQLGRLRLQLISRYRG